MEPVVFNNYNNLPTLASQANSLPPQPLPQAKSKTKLRSIRELFHRHRSDDNNDTDEDIVMSSGEASAPAPTIGSGSGSGTGNNTPTFTEKPHRSLFFSRSKTPKQQSNPSSDMDIASGDSPVSTDKSKQSFPDAWTHHSSGSVSDQNLINMARSTTTAHSDPKPGDLESPGALPVPKFKEIAEASQNGAKKKKSKKTKNQLQPPSLLQPNPSTDVPMTLSDLNLHIGIAPNIGTTGSNFLHPQKSASSVSITNNEDHHQNAWLRTIVDPGTPPVQQQQQQQQPQQQFPAPLPLHTQSQQQHPQLQPQSQPQQNRVKGPPPLEFLNTPPGQNRPQSLPANVVNNMLLSNMLRQHQQQQQQFQQQQQHQRYSPKLDQPVQISAGQLLAIQTQHMKLKRDFNTLLELVKTVNRENELLREVVLSLEQKLNGNNAGNNVLNNHQDIIKQFQQQKQQQQQQQQKHSVSNHEPISMQQLGLQFATQTVSPQQQQQQKQQQQQQQQSLAQLQQQFANIASQKP